MESPQFKASVNRTLQGKFFDKFARETDRLMVGGKSLRIALVDLVCEAKVRGGRLTSSQIASLRTTWKEGSPKSSLCQAIVNQAVSTRWVLAFAKVQRVSGVCKFDSDENSSPKQEKIIRSNSDAFCWTFDE